MSSSSSTFIKDYSKAIAEALREKEQEQTTISTDDKVRDAYTQLCFDDPRVQSDEACRLLSKSLLKGDYAISERLVDGIRQATGRYEQSRVAAIDKSEIENKTGLGPEATRSATAVGYAILAKTVFLEIPLKCCQASNLQSVQKFLGTFRGPQRANTEDQDELGEKLQKDLHLRDDQPEHTGKINEEHDVNHNCINDYEEVFAAESDSSDFFYESSAPQIDWSAWEDTSFDPKKLSEPIENDEWPAVQQAVSNLLRELSHSKFIPIDTTLWKRLDLSDALIQLTLTLLVESNSMNPMLDYLRQWSVQPLNVMRDRILMANNISTNSCTNTTILKDYLNLVQSLIAVDASQPHQATEISIASIVGMADLSSICTQAKNLKEIPAVRKCVIECCEDICSLVERSVESIAGEEIQQGILPSWVRLIWSLIPLFELISNIFTEDGTEFDPSSHTKKLPTADAQWLLNSGLFRQLILFYVKTAPFSGPTIDLARQHLLQTVQFLSLKSMTLLGKYAWRVPELNKLIHQNGFTQENNLVDNLLWSLMGIELSASGSMLRMRNSPVLTPESCRETALKHFHKICKNVEVALQLIEKLRQGSDDEKEVEALTEWKAPINDFRRLSNCITSCPALQGLWKQAFTEDILQEELQQIKITLTELALTTTPSSTMVTLARASKTAENDKAGEPSEKPNHTYEIGITTVHKSVKVITMVFQYSSSAIGHGQLSSKFD